MAKERHATWSSLSMLRAGLRAIRVFAPENATELQAFIHRSNDDGIILAPVGAGSNVIGSDETTPARALVDGRSFLTSQRICSRELTLGCGLSLPKASWLAAQAGLSGMAELSGIPGTLGGAIAMNAGANGRTIGELLKTITVIDLQTGECETWNAQEIAGWGYRTSPVTNRHYVLEATLQLAPSTPEQELNALHQERQRRARTTPKGHSCGSVFRNPPGIPAGKLLEGAGCKGLSKGSFSVSQQHANWIVNLTGQTGSAQDAKNLIQKLQQTVLQQSGYALQPEWRFADNLFSH